MKYKDMISEEDFNAQMARRSSKSPQKDSPGDSGTNANAEVNYGVEYQPTKSKRKKDIPAFDNKG